MDFMVAFNSKELRLSSSSGNVHVARAFITLLKEICTVAFTKFFFHMALKKQRHLQHSTWTPLTDCPPLFWMKYLKTWCLKMSMMYRINLTGYLGIFDKGKASPYYSATIETEKLEGSDAGKSWNAHLALTHHRFDLMPISHINVYNISLFDKKAQNLLSILLFYHQSIFVGIFFFKYIHLLTINILEYKNVWFVDSHYE